MINVDKAELVLDKIKNCRNWGYSRRPERSETNKYVGYIVLTAWLIAFYFIVGALQ